MNDDTSLEPGFHPHVDTLYNDSTRRFEAINLDEAGLVAGQSVMRLFWCESAQRYVTIPGASLYVVNEDGDLVLE